MVLDRFPAATRHAQRALQIGRRTGQGELFPLVVAMLGVSLWVQGRPLEAGELFDGAAEAARLVGNVQNLAWNLFNRSLAALAAGDLDVALATAQESCELLQDMEPGPYSGAAAAALASALLETGQADSSVHVLLTRAGGEELQLIGGGWRARFLELLTRALLAAGRRADAERALAAAAALETVAVHFDAARARELAGRALALAGDRDRAALELEVAAAAFGSFGSLRYRDQAERELRKLGRRIHRQTRPGTISGPGIESLTERELQVARLVVDRKTNPQIAAELFVSQKTVEAHLRNIFGKMGVTTRTALARAVERTERTASPPPR